MSDRFLIDGHNAMGTLRIHGPDHEDARRRLLRRVRDRAPDATVFFDARNAPRGVSRTFREVGVRVVYCDDREADTAILELVTDTDQAWRLVVVTDDRELAGKARQLGGRSLSVARFFRKPAGPGAEELAVDKPTGNAGFRPADFGLPDRVDLDNPGNDLR